ncbi:MerR family transcriptional regulator [Echinimonas agarilytica]|uniref:MerR family transcriptional regulator n=1 Tax=Echinimonas agarilytica TaxID=1215918 RepID=A0AA42B8G5_9GAMM|nr:MerR family transcriptional regulator [Echinimonas agarilytica]MCM2680842.1 MerR family transcriptional regulator [Echinimonas agarilytica]
MTRHLPIQQAATELDVTPDTLRYYEKQGLLIHVGRNTSGHRQYAPADMDWLRFILCLKSTGMPLELIKRYRDLLVAGDHTIAQRQAILTEHHTQIESDLKLLQTNLTRIEQKIEFYDNIHSDSTKSCSTN